MEKGPVHKIRAWSGPRHPNENPICGAPLYDPTIAFNRTVDDTCVTCEKCREITTTTFPKGNV